MSKLYGHAGWIAVGLLALLVVGPVHSDEEKTQVLEEVIVTAQKRVENLQDVPVSTSVMMGEKLENTSITNLESLTLYVPNFSMNQTGVGSTITIRGISSGINQGFEQSVGQYVDGIYYGRSILTRAPFLDLERIEVLRGPQGTLFGKNSIAGAVSMISARPAEEFTGSLMALYEPGDQENDYRLMLSGPLSENVFGRLAALYRDMDGYMQNTFLGRDEKQEDEQVVRASLIWEINDDLSAYLKAERTDYKVLGRNIETTGSVALPVAGAVDYVTALNGIQMLLGRPAVDGDLDRSRDSNGDFSDNTVDNYLLQLDYQMGDYTLTSLSGWLEYAYNEICDCDFTGASLFLADGREDFQQFSQELRLVSPKGGDFDYVAGLYYQNSDLTYDDRLFLPADSILVPVLGPLLGAAAPFLPGASTRRKFTQNAELWAGYFQGTWYIDDAWRLTLGGRYTSEDKEASRRQFHLDANNTDFGTLNPALNAILGFVKIEPYDIIRGSRSESAFTPLAILEWDLSDNTMLYLTWTRGFKSGGFDVRSNGHPDPAVVNAVQVVPGVTPVVNDIVGTFEYGDEKAANFEAGARFGLLDGAAEMNVSVFFTDYSDLQVSQFDGVLGFNVTNAGEASIQGMEMDGRWLATENLIISGSLSFLDFEYDKFPNSQCYFGQELVDPGAVTNAELGLCDVAGERKEYTPKWRWVLAGDHRWPIRDSLQLRTTVDITYVDDYLWNPTLDPRNRQDAYAGLNTRMGLGDDDGKWEIALIGKNLTDEEVINFGGDSPLASLLTQGGGNAYYGFINRGRTIALQLKIGF